LGSENKRRLHYAHGKKSIFSFITVHEELSWKNACQDVDMSDP
jgi:hypothetical protein